MREPTALTRLFGHPVIAAPLILGGMIFLYGCWQIGPDGLLPAVLTLAVLGLVSKAAERMSAYRAWKRAWDGMDGQDRPRGRWKKPLGAVLAALMVAVMIGQANHPGYALALGWMGLFATVVAIVWLWRRVRRVRPFGGSPADATPAVTVCVTPSATPTLDAAYDALPEYCRQVMRR